MGTADNLTILPLDLSVHGDELAQLLVDVYRGHPAAADVRRVRRRMELSDWEQHQDCRIGLVEGALVTNFTVFGYLTRVGQARLRTAGVGAVATHPDWRGQGLMRRTSQEAVDGFHDAGYDISVLFGITDFYHKFGYVRAWSDEMYTVQAAELRPTESPPALTSFREPALPADVVACMNRWLEPLAGSAVRPTHGGTFENGGDQALNVLWRDTAGDVAGVLLCKLGETHVEVMDQCGDPETVVSVLAQLCAEHELQGTRFSLLHRACPLARRLRLGTCNMTTWHCRNGGALVRIVNASSCLEKLRSDLEARLAASVLHAWHGVLLASDGREEVHLHIHAGDIRKVPPVETPHQLLAGDFLASLILGAEEPVDTLSRPSVEVTGDAGALTRALFPCLHPQLPRIDRF